jgi:hypothetical protein
MLHFHLPQFDEITVVLFHLLVQLLKFVTQLLGQKRDLSYTHLMIFLKCFEICADQHYHVAVIISFKLYSFNVKAMLSVVVCMLIYMR